jgi:hypothetical protein
MAPEEGYLIGDLSLLVERDDCECAAAAGLPIDREVFGVGLHKIGVPGIATDVQVIIAKLLSGGLAKDVPIFRRAHKSASHDGHWVSGNG